MIKYLPKILYENIKNPQFIYELLDPDSLEVRYIGKSKDIKRRYLSHINTSKHKRTHKECWINSLILKGKKPILRIICVTIDKHINRVEIENIKNSENLTNATGGGDGQSNISLETISKIKITKCKNKKWNFIKRKKEKKVVGYNILTGDIISFKSTVEAGKYGFNSSHIGSCCRGSKYFNTHKGYIWKYWSNNAI